MRTEWATTGALLLVLASTVLQVSAAGDIYLEGEEDNLNEFLEVREDDTSVFSHLKRFKRQFSFPDFGSFFNREEDSAAKDSDDGYGKDDDVDNFGSGSVDKADPDSREKTLRVTFTANEPYLKSYSDRDSPEFRDFSQTLASAVDKLYDSLPGTQRTSLVRIQSHISDEFSCKVTLDIVTSGYEDIENIKNLLRNHIKTSHRLGKTIVSESDFSAQLIDPGTTFCEENEFKCDEYHCLPLSVKCNGQPDCNDGKDEENCPITSNPNYPENGQQTESYPEYPATNNNTYTNSLYNQPNPETLNPADPNSYDQESLKPAPYDPNLPNYDQSTDDPYYNPEDNYDQKYQFPGNDDQNPSNPDTDDQTSQGPDRNDSDSLNRKTEETPYYVFTTEASNDREPERGDGGRLDETDIPTRAPEETSYTPVSRDPYESAPGSSQVETTTLRNEYTDYDRYVCPPEYIRCDHTRCIEKRQRCDGQTDCDDGTDEANCPELLCGADDFRCDNGNCIELSKRCDHIIDCPNREDELDCDCRPDEFRCESDGNCIERRRVCDKNQDCSDGSDERDCEEACPPDQFSCPGGGCAYKCNGEPECGGGEDEENCPDCAVQCDGKCIPAHQICDRRQDCSDGSDEVGCDFCNHPDDFSCGSGDCIASSLKCNGVSECSDGSDEKDCDSILVPNNGACGVEQFQCVESLECIDKHFYCDGRQDCIDNSDEAHDCHCPPDSWQCHTTSQCISTSKYCDGLTDCSDGSDETNCTVTTQRPYVVPPRVTPTTPNYYTTSGPSFYPGSDSNLYQGPVALNLKTYPNQETVRYVSAGGDVVLQCRDEGPERARVKWHKERGYIKDGSTDVRGRLELFHVTDIDSGVYVCEAEDYSQYPGAQVKVSVIVGSAPTTYRPFQGCQPNEATCGNGQCIPKSAVCNNNIDCADGSDEENCHHSGICEPNEFKCNNGKCVLKTWICDSEDDCGDNSDEQNCGARENGKCSPVEFACQSQNQCIPKSFHCDLQTDCFDGTDEIGCVPVYVKSPPKPQNVKLNPGDTLTLRCEAVGVPVPLISWRLNWGHVPAKCTWTSDNGVGELDCPNMQPDDSGAYSCEAMNNKGTTFATPDAIVFVNKTDLCPRGYFNNEARTERECIRCFCFGKSTQCHSADLFTYNMPTPLGEGGTRLIGIKPSTSGDVNIDSQLITNQYFYQPLRNGATVTKFDDGNYPSNSNPYIIVPETYNGNQLKSYGGHIKYTLSPHASDKNYDDTAATIIIKGKYGSLFHINRFGGTPDINIEASLTPSGWFKYADGSVSATREDIMMVLNDIELILLRADLNNAGVNITDFVMESADHINVGLGAANLVEECTCPKGYEGLSCQKCASGFQRKKVGPWLGDCEPEECPPGTYGDPSSGLDCRPCPCPLTNRENQFARTCSLGSDGSVICDCFQGYQGGHCEVCAPGYEGNPLIPGDSCRPKQISRCDPVGTKSIRPPDECVCKDNVQGRYCNQCKSETFFLSSDFRHGCADCFCSGITQQCTSSNYRRETISVQFNVPQIVDQVRVYSSAPAGRSSVRYSVPKETDLRLELQRGEVVTLNNVESSAQSSVYYWSLPPSFAGDKVTSYGGNLQYVLKNVPSSIDPRYRNTAADVQLISDNKLIFHYFGDFDISHEGILNASINLLEKGWQRPDGNEVTRAQFLLALADVKTILIKATYSSGPQLATPVSASIEIAKENAYGPIASQVEQCNCTQGYVGTSCEDCMPGYTRNKDLSGLYLGQCDPCQCNNKSNMCHPETGKCYECSDNTAGDKCESCKPGYERDPYGNCSPIENPLTCSCDPRGSIGPCDNSGKCNCKQNVEGDSCDRCRPGTFGLDANNPDGCLPCYCSGVTTDCHEGSHYNRVPIAAPILGENYGGYTITDLNADQVIKDNFIPLFEQSELMYNFQFHPDVDYYWSLPIFPGNRVLSYGGSLSLRQKFSSASDKRSERGNDVVLDGGDIRIFWTNPNQFPSETSYSYQVPLKEEGWYILNTATPATHSDFMTVLRNLKRVLVRATVAPDIYVTTIADVSMDTAAPNVDPILPAAKGIEICMNCPAGYSGTSCESCNPGYYKDERGYCRSCPCNGHDCQLDSYGQLVCNCKAPYTGNNCGIIGGSSVTDPTVYPPVTRQPPPEATVFVTIDSPTIQILEVGSSVSFTCTAQSRNTRERLPINWTKKDGHLPRERTQIDEYYGTLQITNLQVSDSGVYICETNDGINTAQAKTTLKVPGNEMTQPTVEISPSVKEYYEGELVELECKVSGNPTPTIRWQRGSNRPLPLFAENRGNLLIIERASVDDSGEYRCIASNAVGSDDRIAMITVRPRPPQPPLEKLTVSNTSPNVDEGRSIRIVCTGSTNVPAGSIDWVRQDNADFTSNVRSENGVLNIDVAVPENQGVYICRSPVSNVAPVQILLTVILKNAVPEEYKISTSVDSLKIPTGGSGTVDCTVTGRPAPLVKWTRTDGPFGPGTSQRGNTLIINDAQASDNGYYLCTGSVNDAPVVYSYVYVDIERREAPKVMIWPEGEQAVTLGGQYELQCRVLSGTPEPYVTWNRNGGRSLSPFTQLQPQNVLRFNKIEVNDEGEYTCTASNAAGSASASAVIKVRSLPEITISPAPNSQNNIEINNGDPLNVECRATGFPEPLVSISFNNYEIVPAQPSHASLRVPSATYNNEGSYTCTATSAAGTAASQFAVLVERGDGADDGGEEIPNYDGNGDNTIDPYDTTDTSPGSNEVPANLYAIEGQTETVIYCNQSGNGKVVWTRGDSQPIEGNVRQSDSRLIILNVSKRDSGSYVCNIYNEYDELQHAIYTSLVVVTAPMIILRPPVQTVQPGQSPTVECLAIGDDLIDVTWRPYNKYPSSRMEIRKNMLIFHEIEVEDAGQYECIATSPHVNTTAIAKVVVNEDSDRSWTSHANEQWAHAGAAVHLQCNVTQPDTNVVWTKDARPLPRSVTRKSDGSLFIRLAHKSDTGRYICSIQDKYGRTITSNYIDLHIQGPRVSQPEQLVYIEPPARPFRVGDNVNVLCKNRPGDISVQWIRPGTNEYVDSIPYGDGAMLSIQRVTYADAGIYRCYGRDARLGRDSYDDFELVVESGPDNPGYSDRDNIHVAEYSARLRDSVDLPCQHNLEPPVNIEWKKEYSRLPAEFRTNQPNLHLEMVTEADAGTYVCRVSNSYVTAEARAILTVKGVIPMFNGNSYIALPSLTEAYRQFDIEISFKTTDNNGLILYNSQEESPSGDYLALQLKDGVPEFILNTGNEPIKKVSSDRPLQLNTWHTIRLSRTASKVTMDVDNIGPFIAESGQWALLELKNQPLYIGGVRDYDQLPVDLAGASGFIGCVSMLILGTKEINIMLDSIDQYGIADCNSCNPNLCQNNGFCQEAHNERGYQCICATGFAGLDCDRTGEACHPGLCGPGKCTDTNTGYKCACPVTHTGTNCETKQSIEYPAFTGSAFLAIKQPDATRSLTMSMNIKAATPVTDGIIMYCAESPRGYGGFTSLTVHNGRLEFRFDLGKGSSPVILVSNKTLPDNAWTKVQISRIGAMVSLKIDNVHSYEQSLPSPFSNQDFIPKTPIFVGGVDDSITLNKNVGVIGGFNGCIKDFTMRGQAVDIVNETIKSANVQECVTYVRGDIPEDEKLIQCQCRNGGRCISETEPTVCSCTPGFTGQLCEERAPSSMRERSYTNPCNASPCQNGGTCRPDFSSRMNYTCDCPLGHAGEICQIELRLYQSVGFNGNGYLELPASALTYNLPLEPTIIAMAIHTTRDGVLLYQVEGLPNYGDYILLRIERGIVVLEWDMGSGRSVISINEEIVTDGERHQIIAKLLEDGGATLSVDSHQRTGRSTGISGIMNVDSNIYIGGIPDQINPQGYPGFTGCVAQLELMDLNRGLNLGEVAVAGRNTQRCRKF